MHLSSSLGDRSLVIEVGGLTAGYGLPLEVWILEDPKPQRGDTPVGFASVSRVPGLSSPVLSSWVFQLGQPLTSCQSSVGLLLCGSSDSPAAQPA